MAATLDLIVDGIDFGEGPRWHDDRLWYSDFYQCSISTVDQDGARTVVHTDLEDQPSGLGWMPDGSLLVVAMATQRVLHEVDGALVTHADLSSVLADKCNDMVVDAAGNAYVGSFGYDLVGGADFVPSGLALVRPDGSVEQAATDLAFPNGMVLTPDGRTLIVGETFGGGYVAYTVGDDATLSDRRQWAVVGGTAPDGCTLDADGAIWFADALGSQVVRVREGGEVTERVETPMPAYACMLGGTDGRTLFILCAPDSRPAKVDGKAAGALYATQVAVPHAGRP